MGCEATFKQLESISESDPCSHWALQPPWYLLTRQHGGIQALKMLSGGYQGHFVDAWHWVGQPRMVHARTCCSQMRKSGLGCSWGWWQLWLNYEMPLLGLPGVGKERSSLQIQGFRRTDF